MTTNISIVHLGNLFKIVKIYIAGFDNVWKKAGNQSFYKSNTVLNFNLARGACHELGGRLVEIPFSYVARNLETFLGSDSKIFIIKR